MVKTYSSFFNESSKLKETLNRSYMETLASVYTDHLLKMKAKHIPEISLSELKIDNYSSSGGASNFLSASAEWVSNVVFDVNLNDVTLMTIQEVLSAKASFIDKENRYDKSILLSVHSYDESGNARSVKQFKYNKSLADLFNHTL